MEILHTLFYFILSIGILVAFHEYGHFWVARKVGVKVIRFSIGFGKIVWRYQKNPDSTEYVLSAVPLGGYVKMVDEREGEVAKEDLPFAFNRQSLLKRTAIVLAGPVFNLLLAVVLYWFVFILGETGMRPIVGPVASDTIALQAGFVEGEEIIAVDGRLTPTWSEAIGSIFSSAMGGHEGIIVKVKSADDAIYNRTMVIPEKDSGEPEILFKKIGLTPWEPDIKPVIGKILEFKPAAEAGLKTGDLVVSMDSIAVENWMDLVDYVQSHPGQSISLIIERDGVHIPVKLTPDRIESEQGTIGKIGAGVYVSDELIESLQVDYRLSPLEAIPAAFARTWQYSKATIKMMGLMLVGKASIENLSGPISIAQYAGQSANMGFVYFLKFIALVSVSLGVLNLMPIPVLDGGHLMLFVIEAIKGSPLSLKTQIIFQNVGMALLLTLMTIAIFLDIERLFQ